MAWLKARLAPLVGAPAAARLAGGVVHGLAALPRVAGRTSGRRCSCSRTCTGPTTALLSFLEHLADWSQGVPLLVLCTARPELYEQHPAWAAGLRNATTINLAPLTDEETARLIASLLERAVLPAETQRALLERAGGNPLYAEEFVRLLADRASSPAVDGGAGLGAGADRRPPGHALGRAQEPAPGRGGGRARCSGRARWPRWAAATRARSSRRCTSWPARSSCARSHELDGGRGRVRLLACCWSGTSATAQIPRAARAARHRAAAAWIERQAGERVEDLADVLAHHYLSALELTRAAGQTEQATELEASAIRYLTLAGERALGARRRPRRAEPRPGARARSGRPSRAGVAARALGAGRAAAGPPPGREGRARGGARPLPRAGRKRSRAGEC